MTVADIIQKAITDACSRQRKWDPEKGELEPWLMAQVNSIMDALAKSATHRRVTHTLDAISGDGAGDDEGVGYVAPPASARVASAEEIVTQKEEVKEQFDLLLEAASGDDQLERMIEVVWEGCDGAPDIAAAMEVTVHEVYNLTRKLKRRVARKREQHGSP